MRIALFACVIGVAGCGSDDSSSAAGGDGGPDAAPAEAGTDATSAEAGTGRDGAGPDAGPQPGDLSVLQMHNHLNRDGLFVDGALTKAALAGGTMHIDAAFDGKMVKGNVHSSPLYVQNGPGGKGTFYVATESNNVYAIDEATGAQVWTASAGSEAGSTGAGCGNIGPIGITGTPAIDATTRLMVFSAATSTTKGGVIDKQTIHAWSIDDGKEAWNLDVSTMSDPVVGAFDPSVHNQRSAVLIVGGVAYVSWGGFYGDCGPYHGWIVGVPLSGPAGAKAYATPAGECGMWGAGGPASDGTSIFMATGNGGDFMGSWGGAFSVLKLQPGPVFAGGASNYWHAVNDTGDVDLGGSAPLIVDAPGMTPSQLVVQLGKDGFAYLIDRANMGGDVSPVGSAQVMNDEISNAAAWATIPSGTYIAMVGNNGGAGNNCKTGSGQLVVVKIDPAAPGKVSSAWCADNQGGGSPSISTSDGAHDPLVWTMGTDTGWGGAASNQLHAWDLETGAPVAMGSDTLGNTRHFTAPIVVHGRVIIGGDDRLYALKP
jgi:hypothetical protein